MDSTDLIIVCYTGGTCGDLVSALIDPGGAVLTQLNGTVQHTDFRQRLKKPHLFIDTADKDEYLAAVGKQYRSIPSHDLNYHVEKKHPFMTITVNESDLALWAAERFRSCHRPHVWKEMTKICGAKDIKGYAQILIDFSNMVAQHTNNVVKLEDIATGKAVTVLENILGQELPQSNKQFYHNWLDIQKL